MTPKAGFFDFRNLPGRRRGVTLHDPMSAAASALNMVITAIAGPKIGPFIAQGMIPGAINLLASPSDKTTSARRSPHLINTRDTDEVVPPTYGEFRKACNWVFAEESGGSNKYLNLVLSWADGLCNGLIYTTEYKPKFTGAGKNDMRIRGTYSGASSRKFRVQIDGTGTPDTFKWSKDDGGSWDASTVAITGDWQDLTEGVQIKFAATTGHTSGNKWTWMTGLGLWVGETLLGFFEDFDPGSLDLADHYWHNGSATQNVDANLQAECPLYNDTNRRTCNSVFRLKYNIEAYPSGVGDFFALARWRHLFDPREVSHFANDETTWAYSNNAGLVAADWVVQRFGMHRSWDRVDLQASIDLANDCDTASMTFNGEILTEQSPEDTLRDIEMCYRGFHFERDGKLVLKMFKDDTPAMVLTEDDVLNEPDSITMINPGIPETPDRVAAWYYEPLEGYAAKQVYYPDTAGLANESALNTQEIDLIGITSRTKAKQLAKFWYLRWATYNRTYSMPLSPRCFALEPGDCFNITHRFFGDSAVKLRVMAPSVTQDNGWVRVTAIIENSALYDTTVNTASDDITITPGIYTYPPDVSAGAMTVGSGRFKFSWTKIPNLDLKSYIIYVYTSNTPASAVVIARTSGKKTTETIDFGVESETGSITLTVGTAYYFWITALDENDHESLNKFYLGATDTPSMSGFAPTVTGIRKGKLLRVDWSAWTGFADDSIMAKLKEFEVYYSTNSGCAIGSTATLADTVSSKKKSCDISGLSPGAKGAEIEYYARVRPVGWAGNGTASDVGS